MSLLMAYLKCIARLGWFLQQFLRLLQFNLLVRRDLLGLIRADQPAPSLPPTPQLAMLCNCGTAVSISPFVHGNPLIVSFSATKDCFILGVSQIQTQVAGTVGEGLLGKKQDDHGNGTTQNRLVCLAEADRPESRYVPYFPNTERFPERWTVSMSSIFCSLIVLSIQFG